MDFSYEKKNDGTFELPLQLIEAVRFVVISMVCDFAQYTYKSLAYLHLAHKAEKNAEKDHPISDDLKDKESDSEDELKIKRAKRDAILKARGEMDILVDSSWNIITNSLFYLKIIILGCAYYKILSYLNEVILKAS